MDRLEHCANIKTLGIQEIRDLWPMEVFEMTREPMCDRRKPEKEGA